MLMMSTTNVFLDQFNESYQVEAPAKKRKVAVYNDDDDIFHSILKTPLPETHESIEIEPFLAPETWLNDTCEVVLKQANLVESDNPRVSPVALVRCSRGGKTRSMMELMQQIRKKDPKYGILYVTFNTATPLQDSPSAHDPVAELCVRIAFAALKKRKPHDIKEFVDFCNKNTFDSKWVEKWLREDKCILFIDELNLVQSIFDNPLAQFLKSNFLLGEGRGLVFSSHVASLSNKLSSFLESPSNRQVITLTLPVIPSLREAIKKFSYNELSARKALFLGLIPGLIVEHKYHHKPTQRRKLAVENFVEVVNAEEREVYKLLKTLLTGDELAVDKHLLELMTTDVTDDDTMILRWIPFHMVYVIEQVSTQCLHLPMPLSKCLKSIADLFIQFSDAKWEGGDAWEALFLIVLLIRCLTNSFDDEVVPLDSFIPNDVNVSVAYNNPLKEHCDFHTADVEEFIASIPEVSHAKPGECAISIYYPNHASFEVYDVILAFWNVKGERYLYGYQLKEGKTIPKNGPKSPDLFCRSFLIRGLATQQSSTVNRWSSVSEAQLDKFFGVSAKQWSAKKWKELQDEEST
jgi:hypothetical protein